MTSCLLPGIPSGFALRLLVIYTLSHAGLFVILNAIYWDDWVLYGQSSQDLLETFFQAGSMLNIGGYLHANLLAVGPWLYRVLTFFLGLYSVTLFWHILNRQHWLGTQHRDLATLFFAAAPLFAAKVALIDLPYTLCLFLFLLGWLVMEKNRLVALVLFFFSFTTNSLLMLFALPMLDCLLRGNALKEMRALLLWCRRWLAFLALPFIYWYIKTIHYKPSGLYAGYNENLSLANLKFAPVATLKDFTGLSINLSLLTLLFFAIAFFYRPSSLEREHTGKIAFAGMLAFVLGALPYWLLGHVPAFHDWSSRHQVLLPIGFSLIAVWLVLKLPEYARNAAVIFLLALGLTQNLQIYNEYAADWHKQKSIIAQLRQSELARDATLMVFDDPTENARRRIYRFYEWNGLLRQAFGERGQFGISASDLARYQAGEYDRYFNRFYVAEGHVRDSQASAVMIEIRTQGNRAAYKWPKHILTVTPLGGQERVAQN